MRTISFPAQGDYPECSLALPYSRNAAEFTIFHTPLGWRYATGTGNVFTGIAGEEKVLEIALWGAAGSQVGWAAVTDVVISDAPDEIVLQDARDSKKADLAARRYEIEVSGVSAGGQMIATDDRSKAMIAGAALGALAKLVSGVLPSEIQPLVSAIPETVDWKGEDGFSTRPIADVLAAGVAVQAHVQPLFSREKALGDFLDAITSDSAGSLSAALEQIDAVTWETEI